MRERSAQGVLVARQFFMDCIGDLGGSPTGFFTVQLGPFLLIAAQRFNLALQRL
jgi:hypothetical protein